VPTPVVGARRVSVVQVPVYIVRDSRASSSGRRRGRPGPRRPPSPLRRGPAARRRVIERKNDEVLMRRSNSIVGPEPGEAPADRAADRAPTRFGDPGRIPPRRCRRSRPRPQGDRNLPVPPPSCRRPRDPAAPRGPPRPDGDRADTARVVEVPSGGARSAAGRLPPALSAWHVIVPSMITGTHQRKIDEQGAPRRQVSVHALFLRGPPFTCRADSRGGRGSPSSTAAGHRACMALGIDGFATMFQVYRPDRAMQGKSVQEVNFMILSNMKFRDFIEIPVCVRRTDAVANPAPPWATGRRRRAGNVGGRPGGRAAGDGSGWGPIRKTVAHAGRGSLRIRG
jgi:hypothetical protein